MTASVRNAPDLLYYRTAAVLSQKHGRTETVGQIPERQKIPYPGQKFRAQNRLPVPNRTK
jgi:hypothetical protein